MKLKLSPLITIILFLSTYANAQFTITKQVKPYFGRPAIKKKVSDLKANSAGRTIIGNKLDTTAIKPYRSYFKRFNNLDQTRITSPAPAAEPEDGNTSPSISPAIASPAFVTPGPAQKIWSNFLGIDFYENPTRWPPDPSGAVSESQVIIATNIGVKVFEKRSVSAPPLITPDGYSRDIASSKLFLSLEQLFSPVLPPGSSISDPHIRYDRLSKRWFIMAIEINPSLQNNLVLLAVSDGDRITNQSSFLYYSFNSSLFPYDHNATNAPFLDFPTLGVDKHSVLIGGNQFGPDSLTNVGYVIDKNRLIRGELMLYPFELGVASFVSARIGGVYTPHGVQNDDGGSDQSVFAGLGYYLDQIALAKFGYDSKDRPWFISEIFIPIETYSNPGTISSPGGLIGINPNDARLLSAAIHKNKLTGKNSLWTAHAIGINQSGRALMGTDSDFVRVSRTGSRWYEIGDIYSKPVLSQKGTLFDVNQKSGRRAVQYFNPSIAANGQGHAILSGTTTAYNQYLNVFVAGRFYKDSKGFLHEPQKATKTTAIYAPYLDLGGGNHSYIDSWGDFSQTVVDPADDQTIWTFQEYANADDSYGVRAVQLKAPPPATPLPFAPIWNKTDSTVTVEGICVDNSGFFDPGKDIGGPGYNRLTVKSSGNILVSNVKFVDPTKITFTLGVKNKPAGNYTLAITNPDGQFVVINYLLKAGDQPVAHKIGAVAPKIPEVKTTGIIKVAPNPTNDNTNILINAVSAHTGKIILLDLSGKQLFEKSYQFVKGENSVLISLSNLSNGTYIAAIYNSADILQATQKIIKQ